MSVRLTPGEGGVFVVKLDGEVFYDKAIEGKTPDLTKAKEIKAEVRNRVEAATPARA